jgi:hypothetical protein
VRNLEVGAIYKHYKGMRVKVLAEALDSENLEKMVVYIHLEDGFMWVRPKNMFLEKVKFENKIVFRFSKINQKNVIKPSK